MSLGVDRHAGVEELRALAHPTRLRMLSLLTGAAMTAADVARELQLTHANASYHLRLLHAAGAIEVAGEERIRGGAARRYRYNPDRTPPALTPGEHATGRRVVYMAFADELRRRAARLRDVPEHNHATDAELWVDPAAWTEFRTRIVDASHALHKAARPARTPGAIRTNATLAIFEMDPQ